MEMNKDGFYLGFDPGTKNLSIAYLYKQRELQGSHLFQIELERSDDPVTRTIGIHDLLNDCIGWTYYPMYACIEGASFGDRYRQVELAEVRASAVVWCYQKEFTVKVIPPLVIRKKLFGNGMVKPQDVWTNVPPDCANALACAYYATSLVNGT